MTYKKYIVTTKNLLNSSIGNYQWTFHWCEETNYKYITAYENPEIGDYFSDHGEVKEVR